MLIEILRQARQDANLTQEDLADLLDVPREWVSRLESGSPTLALQRLESAFDVLGLALVAVPKSATLQAIGSATRAGSAPAAATVTAGG